MTPYFYCKKFSSEKRAFIRAHFAIPEGALVSGFHCILPFQSAFGCFKSDVMYLSCIWLSLVLFGFF